MEPHSNEAPSSVVELDRTESPKQREYEALRLRTNIPPYWQYQRAVSSASVISNGKPPPITLEDHTEEAPDLQSPLWARTVTVEDYVVVSGSVKGIGDYVVWTCKVDTLDGGSITLRKRYSDFEHLRARLVTTFPNSKAAMPKLPPKNAFKSFRPDFLEKRRTGLAYFMNCILLNPEFSGCPAVLNEFIFN